MALRKKGSAKTANNAAAQPLNKNWEAGLVRAQLEEDSWRLCVSLVVGESREEEEITRALSLAVQKPQRKRFTLLSWDSTIEKIHELGNPKAKITGNAPMFYEVTKAAKQLLDAGEKIPCDLMAKILKFQLLQIKANDQRLRKEERAEREKEKIIPSSDNMDKSGAKTSGKKGKAPPTPVTSMEKKTKLKRRDEIDPPTFIDDEPDSGPQHYVLLVGFYEPHLIALLDVISIHVANIIKLCSEDTHTFREEQEQPSCLRTSPVKDAEVDFQAKRLDLFWSGLRRVLESGPPDSKLHDTVQLSYIVPVLSLPHPQEPEALMELGSHILDGVARLIYDCLERRRQHEHYRDSIKLINLPTVAGLDSESAEVVPSQNLCSEKKSVQGQGKADKEPKLLALSVHTDMRYYSNLLDPVPPEACSVPLILHCMLEQVVISTEQSLPTLTHTAEERKPDCNGPYLDHQLVSVMLQNFLPLIHTGEERSRLLNNLLATVEMEEDRKRLMEKFGAVKTQKKSEKTLVIRHHDERATRLRDIPMAPGFSPAEVEISMMKLSPVWELIQSVAKPRNSTPCWMSIKQQLQHFCTDDALPWPDVQRLFHQSVFEAMTLTTLDQQGVLLNTGRPLGILESAKQQTSIIPWDNPFCYAKQQLHNLQIKDPTFLTEDPDKLSGKACVQLDLSEMQSSRLRSLLEWHYTEHHDAAVFPQVLQSASEVYRCSDMFRGSHNNILYIFCHNPMSSDRQSKEFWDVKLHTDVKFRKYLKHVADTILNWTQEEELKRDTIQIQNQRPADPPKDVFPPGLDEKAVYLAENEDKLEPVIRKDSLKAWKLEQEPKKTKEDTAKGKQQEVKTQPTDTKKSKASGASKKSRPSTACSTSIAPPESTVTVGPCSGVNKDLHPTEDPFRGFIGYCLDGQLIHVSGCVQNLFPSDGGQITVENISFLEGSSLMKVAVKKDGHHFYTHINQVVNSARSGLKVDCKGPEPLEMKTVKQGSFSAVLDNKIHLSYSFYGSTGECTVSSQEAKEENSNIFISEPASVPSFVPHTKRIDMESVPSKTHIQPIQECKEKPVEPPSPFSSLNASAPNGLLIQFLQEDIQGASLEEKDVLVRQSFPLHGRGQLQHLQDISLSKERCRIITGQGAVIRCIRDGSTEVLFPDGSVSFSKDSGPVWVWDPEAQKENSDLKTEDKMKDRISEQKARTDRGCWCTTSPSGNRICTIGTTHKRIPTSSLLTFKSTDPITHQVMVTREDLVVSVQNPDGSQIVEHADGTRITTLFQDRPIDATSHLFHTGQKPGSVTVKSTSRCESSYMCDTHSVDSLNETVHIPDACDNEDAISRNSAGHTCDNKVAGRSLSECGWTQSNLDKKDEQSVFPEKNGAEKGKMSPCESEKGNKSTKERVLLVEKEGCATTVMYPERHTSHIFLADRTIITGNNQGKYEVFPSSKGFLQIQSDGKYTYSSDPLVTLYPKHCSLTNQPGIYTMSHREKVACDFTDDDGNHFQVMDNGQVSVLCSSSALSTPKHDEEQLDMEEEDSQLRLCVKPKEHCPRLFLVHEDGSGTELLSSHTVEELLQQAHSDPTIALQMEPLPDKQDEFGIIILKPSHLSVWSQWLLGKQNPAITPPNLKNRSWDHFPSVEKNSPGPLFGTNIGVGLTLRERPVGSAAQRQPVRSCPEVLEMRELYQHRSFTTPLKNIIDSRLKEYIESLMVREQQSEEMKVKDHRTEDEISYARNLLSLFLPHAERVDANHTTDTRIAVDVGSLYSRGVGASVEQSDGSEDTNTEISDSLERFQCYNNAKDSKWAERLAKHRKEISEDKTYRKALQKKLVTPYFHPENNHLFQNLLHHREAHKGSLSVKRRSLFPKSDSAEALVGDVAKEHTPRPLNPTPSQSKSHAIGSNRVPEKRPTNPTPQTAGKSSLGASSRQCKSMQVDVTGKPRRSKVRLPTCILSSKPCSVPNQHFLTVEEPVRRKCRTVSLTDPSAIMRGFQLFPSKVDFGVLQGGTTSTITVVMRNVGVDTCRFHVKQPPPATGLRVIYIPGPVPAGLHVELQVQLFAMPTAQPQLEPKTFISQDITINTETDILYLPVSAIILPWRLTEKGNPGLSNHQDLTHMTQHTPDQPSNYHS